MPAPQYSDHPRSRPAAAALPQRGFTLLELMVVVLVMGLTVGLVSAIVQPDERGLLDLEARRLATLLDLATAEARYGGFALAWVAESHGYAFERQDASGAWAPVRDNDALRPRALPAAMQLASLQIEGSAVPAPLRVEFYPFGTVSSFVVGLNHGAAHSLITMSPLGTVRVETALEPLP